MKLTEKIKLYFNAMDSTAEEVFFKMEHFVIKHPNLEQIEINKSLSPLDILIDYKNNFLNVSQGEDPISLFPGFTAYKIYKFMQEINDIYNKNELDKQPVQVPAINNFPNIEGAIRKEDDSFYNFVPKYV